MNTPRAHYRSLRPKGADAFLGTGGIVNKAADTTGIGNIC